MNERIREFAERATSYSDTLDVADKRIYREIRDREFAELIVQECCEQIREIDAMEIRKHFGIEEKTK